MAAVGDNPDDTIVKSSRVLSGWNWMSRLTSDPDEVVRILNEEAVALAQLAMAHPEKAPTVLRLIEAYKALALRVQQQPPLVAPSPPPPAALPAKAGPAPHLVRLRTCRRAWPVAAPRARRRPSQLR